MTRRILITPDGEAFVDGHDDATGYALEADMDPRDTLPSHVIPCPDRPEWPVEAWGVLA